MKARRRSRPRLALDPRRRTRAGKVTRHSNQSATGRGVDPRHRIRRRRGYHALRGALARCAARPDFRVVHVSIQASHLHLLVEADTKVALARGV